MTEDLYLWSDVNRIHLATASMMPRELGACERRLKGKRATITDIEPQLK